MHVLLDSTLNLPLRSRGVGEGSNIEGWSVQKICRHTLDLFSWEQLVMW